MLAAFAAVEAQLPLCPSCSVGSSTTLCRCKANQELDACTITCKPPRYCCKPRIFIADVADVE